MVAGTPIEAIQQERDRIQVDRLDRRAGGDAAEDRQFARVVGDGQIGRRFPAFHELRLERRAALGRGGRGRLLRQLHHLQRAGPVRQAAQKPALLQRRDQAVDARLRRKIQRLLHFIKGGGNPGLLDPLMDEHEKFVLLAGEHGCRALENKALTSEMFSRCS